MSFFDDEEEYEEEEIDKTRSAIRDEVKEEIKKEQDCAIPFDGDSCSINIISFYGNEQEGVKMYSYGRNHAGGIGIVVVSKDLIETDHKLISPKLYDQLKSKYIENPNYKDYFDETDITKCFIKGNGSNEHSQYFTPAFYSLAENPDELDSVICNKIANVLMQVSNAPVNDSYFHGITCLKDVHLMIDGVEFSNKEVAFSDYLDKREKGNSVKDTKLKYVSILGEYEPNTHHVVLYIKVIEEIAKSEKWDITKLATTVYVHELMHAYFHNVRANGNNAHDYSIEETMAEFGTLLFLEEYWSESPDFQKAFEMVKDKKKYNDLLPYALGAYCFINKDDFKVNFTSYRSS